MKKNCTKSRPPQNPSDYTPRLDDYDLPPHIDIDYSKAKPNRFAARPKIYRGGVRPRADKNHDKD